MDKVILLLAAMFMLATVARTIAAPFPDEVKTLLSRLDLDRPELQAVKASANDPQQAAAELLKYYRTRKAPGHPNVQAHGAADARGHAATPEDVAIADDALRNILITAPEYPRFDFGEKIDWFTNRSPTKDLEWIVQLHRHYSWMPLGKAYWHTGDEKYAQAYCRQLADWLEHCPPSNGRPVWGTLEMGIRGHAWTCHFNYFLDSPSFTPELLVRQLNSLYEHADRLTRDRKYTVNNWGLMEAEGTAFIAVTFPEFKDAPSWRQKAFAHLAGEIKKQVLPDGMHVEMCFDYHEGSIEWLGRTAQLARLNGLGGEFSPDYDRTIERMYEVLGLCAHPNGRTSMFGDDRPSEVAGALQRGAAEFPNNPTLAFLASAGRKGVPPPTATALSSAGIYSLRSAWTPDAIHLILKCGRDGGWHCQPDNGTFELYAFGRYLMPDSGCYIYSGDAQGRAWFRQTRVHQTLTLDGKDTAFAAKQLLWQTGDDLDALVVENASYKDLTHRRAVFFIKKKLFAIVDEALGSAAGDVDLHFQLGPDSRPEINAADFSVRTDYGGGEKTANLLLQAAPQAGLTMESEAGQVSLAYGQKEPRPALFFRLKKTAATTGLRFVTLVVPCVGPAPGASVRVVGDPAPGTQALDLEITVGRDSYHVRYDLDAGKARLQ